MTSAVSFAEGFLLLMSPVTSVFCVPEVTFLTDVSLGSVIDQVTKGVLLALVNQVFVEDIAHFSLVRVYYNILGSKTSSV